jgi:hypothetical protein
VGPYHSQAGVARARLRYALWLKSGIIDQMFGNEFVREKKSPIKAARSQINKKSYNKTDHRNGKRDQDNG